MQSFKTKAFFTLCFTFINFITLTFVTQAIEKFSFQIKTWLQSLNQSMTFSSFKQNCWKWCDDKLIWVPV